jgi:tripartite-type tricarboxylate transporter receptor subunit TctC
MRRREFITLIAGASATSSMSACQVSLRFVVIAFLSLVVPCVRAEAQWLSGKTVRIIVPFAAGSVADVVTRLLAQEVGDETTQTIVVENRPGGGGVIGTEVVARSSPDGATLLFVSNSFLINASLRTDLPYDPLTSFSPICLLALSPMIFVVNSSSNYQSLSQLITAARDPQSTLTVGGTGPNTTQHVAVEALKRASDAHLQFVPFGGDPPVIGSLLGGHVAAALVNYGSVKLHLGAGLRALAVGSHDRLADLPDVPTFSEAGYDEINALPWLGLVLPEKVPSETITQIAAHFRYALNAPAIQTKLRALSLVPIGSCGEEFGVFLREQQDLTARSVKASNMKID